MASVSMDFETELSPWDGSWTKSLSLTVTRGNLAVVLSNGEGFQRLVTEVSMNRAGVVIGLEVSRLARNCGDWHRLLEICALTRHSVAG